MHNDPSKNSNTKTYSTLYDENITVEQYLMETFSWSKQFYKKQNFPKSWSGLSVKAKYSYAIPIECINHGKISMANSNELSKVKILAENDFVVAMSKEEKIHSHPLSYGEMDNVLSILLAQGRGDLLQVNSSQYDRCLLYRLDFETSGLMLAAKTDEVYNFIRRNFSTVMLQKTYRLKCHGQLKFPKGQWMHWLMPSGKSKSKMMALNLPDQRQESQQAELSYSVINFDENKNQSEVEVYLKTGLRHQIRVQFAAMGHPILGDDLYSGIPSKRLYLHAYQYHLELERQKMNFTAELPVDW